ncbi:MAG: IclR family transcriptional regulator [Alphaproteobacteria bacterium]|nr:IclR family transcriptional regulator [Alphaproteobacteria bacterium]
MEISSDSGPSRGRPRGRPRGWTDSTEQNRIKSLDRALDLLDLLARMDGATLSELAQEAGQSPATVYRVLTTFQQHDYVDFDAGSQTWHIGPGAFLTGSTFLRRTSLVERARPIMRALMEETGETANLGIERDGQVLFVSQIETHAAIRAFFPPGTQSPMHASGIGKALLAHLSEARLTQLLTDHWLEGFTERTITAEALLRADLAETRDRGYALDSEERHRGMRCIAAPVFNQFGEAIAGLSISGPAERVSDARLAGLGATVREAAATLSMAMGTRRATT